ncbi:winged helix-turn-helix domain-containing protein [Escherichia coli]|nr:winged helix-turn-helix domain-containing protein [Escherichia coli]HAJ7145490.1 hypothetical protein [Escherichia coli]HAJ7257733.1 hypothetical protein [Escherichia coli]HAJ7262569.1 hypothetical protein [Escherichia coli]HBA2641100.1 hypothetical protein [Escherichia coli]
MFSLICKHKHTSSLSANRYLFDDFEFNNNGLFYKQKRVHIPPKESKILQCFLKNPARVHSKDELIKAGWGDESPGDESLTRCIYVLRSTFYSTTGKNYIKTLYKKGYLFQERVIYIDDNEKTYVAICLPEREQNQDVYFLKKIITENLLSFRKQGVYVIPASVIGSTYNMPEFKEHTKNIVDYFISGYFFNNEYCCLELIDAEKMILVHSENLHLSSLSTKQLQLGVKKITDFLVKNK